MASVVVLAVPSGRNYENEQYLDGARNNFLLRWTVFRTSQEIEMEFQVNCTGWLGLVISAGTASGDVILGGYNDATGLPYVEVVEDERKKPHHGHLF